jgi:hypothetical protein
MPCLGEALPEEEEDLTSGARLSARRRREKVPIRDPACWAMGRIWCWAGLVPCGPFFLPFSFIFLISSSFITFPNKLQIQSNQILKFSTNQNNNTKQKGRCFPDKSSFQENFTNLANWALFA